jgi:hypothetical protein
MKRYAAFLFCLFATVCLADPVTVASTAYEASHVFLAKPGRLMALVGYNSKASAQFIQIHNTTTVPGDSAVPIVTFTVAASSNFSFAIPNQGLPCDTGITVCNSSTGPTKTIGSADVFFTGIVSQN